LSRLKRACAGVDCIVHAAALKQVPAAEYNPFEAIKTNVQGAQNIIDAAIECGVKKVIALSTDKAVNPVNLYGATKLCAEKVFTAGNAYVSAGSKTFFSLVRYGNVMGSRGSVVPFFLAKRKTGVLPITDVNMTRFWITLKQGVQMVLSSIERMKGGEIFIPKIPSLKVVDLARAIAPECKHEVVGIRPGEKLHELLISEEEMRHAREFDDSFLLEANFEWFESSWLDGKPVTDRLSYSSKTNDDWLSVEQLKDMLEQEEGL
jgi:UDP-N-acetylglucosamine 4,6-dehydratase